jgi:hypothetical protein
MPKAKGRKGGLRCSVIPEKRNRNDDRPQHAKETPLQSVNKSQLMSEVQKWKRGNSRFVTDTPEDKREARSGRFKPRRAGDPRPAEYYRASESLELPRPVGSYLEIFRNQHGRGIRTTRDEIPQGTVLYTETAAILNVIHFYDEEDDDFDQRVRRKVVNALSSDQFAKFVSLSHEGADDTEESRFRMNCFENRDPTGVELIDSHYEADPEDIESIYTLWLDIAMLNHSCRPNVIMITSGADSATAHLVAATDLPVKGTEVTISYMTGEIVGCKEVLRGVRQQTLKGGWGFVCSCDACGEPKGGQQTRRVKGRKILVEDEYESSDELNEKESPDDRLDYLNTLAMNIGLLGESANNNQQNPSIENLEKHFSQYEALLQKERMVYRLYEVHNKALDAYRHHWVEGERDELTFARILYHREQHMKYARICYGAQEGVKCAREYVDELQKMIKSPTRKRGGDNQEERQTAEPEKRRRMIPSKGPPWTGTHTFPVIVDLLSSTEEVPRKGSRTMKKRKTTLGRRPVKSHVPWIPPRSGTQENPIRID